MTADADGIVATRTERRRRSRAAILDAARALFARNGFERTTIRAVAEQAGIDPALVMQHFGSKAALFAAAARWTVPVDGLVQADRSELARAAVQHVLDAFDDDHRDAVEALLRSSLTHPAAAELLRDQVIAPTQARVADTIGDPDAALRSALLNACTLGLTISRYLLAVPALAEADPSDIRRILVPALESLTGSGRTDPAQATEAATA
ncbi:TetR/AcrR family transcriptional regulator [Pseudonocardia oceani]|uniref:TetR/AcrR family transcriptional regulator n=1 Tax=Pseudonocardia oceani TaxID=2792013 RepID=UPI001C49EA97|nr:TetR family transcriptional regulator [Pseudonocardia oceani]